MDTSVVPLCDPLMVTYPGSIRGRLRTDLGEAGWLLVCGDDMRSKSGERTVLRSGRVISFVCDCDCDCGVGSCCGTLGQVTVSGERDAAAGRLLSWVASILSTLVHPRGLAVVDMETSHVVFDAQAGHVEGGGGC